MPHVTIIIKGNYQFWVTVITKLKIYNMNSSLRTKVLLLLIAAVETNKYDLFNKAFELYKETPEKSHSVEVKLNRVGFTDDALANLLYDLQKLHGISDTEIAAGQIKPIVSGVITEEAPSVPGEGLQEEATAVAHKVLEHTEETTVPHQYVEATELEPLRTEFPFLNDKDCPEVMFVVVGKRISAYRRYQELHAKLQEILAGTLEVSAEEQTKIAMETQEANAENLALWEELNHYNTTGEILGKHPLFRESVAKKEVDAMTNDQLAKYRTSSATFFSKKRTALKAKGLTDEKKAELEQAIADREYKLGLVNTKLGVDGNK